MGIRGTPIPTPTIPLLVKVCDMGDSLFLFHYNSRINGGVIHDSLEKTAAEDEELGSVGRMKGDSFLAI
jgi:hypothetical protein